MSSNIQDMLMENELYGRSYDMFLKFKKNKGKYASRKLQSDGSTRTGNCTKTGKNNILMEIDIEEDGDAN
jgi:hypothetical protein